MPISDARLLGLVKLFRLGETLSLEKQVSDEQLTAFAQLNPYSTCLICSLFSFFRAVRAN
jgi:hypothetical protein